MKKSNYTFSNRSVFALVMRDENICKEFLTLIFPDRKIKKIRKQETNCLEAEKTIVTGIYSKGVRFDVLFEDEDAWYDIEMQVIHEKHLPKRIRYYQSAMDINILQSGKDYIELKPTFVIFICLFDAYGLDQPLYSFEAFDKKLCLPLGDEKYTIILNTACSIEKVPDELKAFYTYVRNGLIEENPFIKHIHGRYEAIKDSEELKQMLTVEEDMKILQHYRKIAEEEARIAEEEARIAEEEARIAKEELASSKLDIARNLKRMNLTTQQIIEATGLPRELIESL